MKNILFVIFSSILSLQAFAQHDHHEAKKDSIKPKSPRKSAMAMVGSNHVHIDYGSPSVRGRNIWNGLVAYNQVWATGAHKATWIEFSEDVKINNQPIAKGKYGIFTIPNKKEWIIIISKDWNMHLADDYNSKNDVLRIKVKPKKNKALTEELTYYVQKISDFEGITSIAWEYVMVSFEFQNIIKK